MLHMRTSIKGIMESESSLLAASYNIDGASSLDESQRDEGSSSSALKIVYSYYEFFFVYVNNSTLKRRILRE